MASWQENIGKIVLGDCMDVLRQIPDGAVDVLLTEPPYGIPGREESERGDGGAGAVTMKRKRDFFIRGMVSCKRIRDFVYMRKNPEMGLFRFGSASGF